MNGRTKGCWTWVGVVALAMCVGCEQQTMEYRIVELPSGVRVVVQSDCQVSTIWLITKRGEAYYSQKRPIAQEDGTYQVLTNMTWYPSRERWVPGKSLIYSGSFTCETMTCKDLGAIND